MVLSKAQATVEAAGYRVDVRNESSSDVDQWYVIGTDPAPGTRLPEHETVVIRQSSGEG
ncbi:PASTA domain-containing protein [Brachybacterium sp. Z12]|uniref:PASTA domain-containing protein n=1 Tax=Brachybacterium sp. Z12 TaxID=2759167 RepID=UPI00223AF92F|nr:PASTA domain-containing protein [Brachybacterium sp. Z12]